MQGKKRKNPTDSLAITQKTDEVRVQVMALVEDLPTVRRRLFVEMFRDLDSMCQNRKELCRRADCSDKVFHECMHSYEFQRARRLMISWAVERWGEVVRALEESACNPGPEHAADRRTILQLAGCIGGNSAVDDVESASNEAGDLHDGVLLWYYQKTGLPRENWLPEMRAKFEAGLVATPPESKVMEWRQMGQEVPTVAAGGQ